MLQPTQRGNKCKQMRAKHRELTKHCQNIRRSTAFKSTRSPHMSVCVLPRNDGRPTLQIRCVHTCIANINATNTSTYQYQQIWGNNGNTYDMLCTMHSCNCSNCWLATHGCASLTLTTRLHLKTAHADYRIRCKPAIIPRPAAHLPNHVSIHHRPAQTA